MNKPLRIILENQTCIMHALYQLMATGNFLEVGESKKLKTKYEETIEYLKEE